MSSVPWMTSVFCSSAMMTDAPYRCFILIVKMWSS